MKHLARPLRVATDCWGRRPAALLTTVGTLAAVGLTGLVASWWGETLLHALVPMWRDEWDTLPAETRTRAEGQFRLAIIQAAAAIGGVIALLYTARNYELSRRSQVIDKLNGALEKLNSTEMHVRLSGVHTLEQIALDEPQQATRVLHVLESLIRGKAPRVRGRTAEYLSGAQGAAALRAALNQLSAARRQPAVEVQAALVASTNLDIRRHSDRQINFSGKDLSWAELPGAHLADAVLARVEFVQANLRNANLARSSLYRAHLRSALLSGADCTACNIIEANLVGAWLSCATLVSARLGWANLLRVHADHANFSGAYLIGANLKEAWLVNSNFAKALLSNANLTEADLSGADLTGSWLTGTDLTGAHLDGAKLQDSIGLTVHQVLSAIPTITTQLPPNIATHHAVTARIEALETAKEKASWSLGDGVQADAHSPEDQ